MRIYVDSEGTPVQEFSAIYVNEETFQIDDVFHEFVIYPCTESDEDKWARNHVHGLNLDFLAEHGLRDEGELVSSFYTWLKDHPYDMMYGNGPFTERHLLSLPIEDVNLKPWSDRDSQISHKIAMALKLQCARICNVKCATAHRSFRHWRPVRVYNMSAADKAKLKFRHHCSFYDCIECFLYHTRNERGE